MFRTTRIYREKKVEGENLFRLIMYKKNGVGNEETLIDIVAIVHVVLIIVQDKLSDLNLHIF